MKRITVDLPDEIYKQLMKIQYEEFERSGTKPSLREIVNNLINDGISSTKKAPQN